MTFRDDVDLSSSRARRSGGGMKLAAGGGIGTIIVAVAFFLLGGDPAELNEVLNQQQAQGPRDNSAGGDTLEHCRTGADANRYADCRVSATAQSLDAVWAANLPEQAGIEYSQPGLVIFDNSTRSGCGMASAATGPFYCPVDQTAYFDVSFFDQIVQLGGENAPLAQEYIVAHEFGHHLQNLEGTLGLSDYKNPGADSNAVKIELQADCYAGVWAHYADDGEGAFLEPITDEQVRDAVQTARAVGDDNIQKRSQGEVRPDAFTHGSSEQRERAFLAGYRSGSMSSCDTLDRGGYRM
ncbi:neutral zinc metallopeptidase [Corynebacterium sp. CCM 9186]|uniref:KPN_02809 family neutral zinc metallopeptidase n=1 Tax=Corynebacterium meridianum TaxID=2765363 RepID=UPI0020044D84|nr:neutral zinc metallopeptidase [Corynebacterium meridianum]MCK7676637.1 neutral zinc metallopeptidase [Corynebacterium meridianum]